MKPKMKGEMKVNIDKNSQWILALEQEENRLLVAFFVILYFTGTSSI